MLTEKRNKEECDVNVNNNIELRDVKTTVEVNSGQRSKWQYKDGVYGWVIVFTAFIIQFIGDGVAYTLGLFVIEISREYPEVGKSGASLIVSICVAATHGTGYPGKTDLPSSIFPIIIIFIWPMGSILLNRYGSRVVSICGSLIASLGFGSSYFATNTATLYVTIGILGGIGFGLLYLPANVSVAQYFDKKLAFAMGIAVAGSGTGTFFFEWAFGLILARFTWKEGFLITAGIIALTLPFGLLYRPFRDHAEGVGEIPGGTKVEEKVGKVEKVDENWSLRSAIDWTLFKNVVFLLFALSDFLMSVGVNTSFVYLPEIEQNLTKSPYSSLLRFISGLSVVSRLVMGYLSDRCHFNRRVLYTCALMLAGIATMVSPHCRTLTLLRVYAATYGVCMGLCVGFKSVILVDLLGLKRYSDAFGLLLLVQAIGFFMGTPIVGYLYDYFGSYVYGFYFSGFMIYCSGVALGLLSFFTMSKKKDYEEVNHKPNVVTSIISI